MKKKNIILMIVLVSILLFPFKQVKAMTSPWFTTSSNKYSVGNKVNIDEITEVEVGKTLQLYGMIVHGNDVYDPDNPDGIGLFVDEVNLSGITWSSNNSSIATVDNTGKVTGVSIGTTKINATYNGESREYKITIKESDSTNALIRFYYLEPEPAKILNKEYGFALGLYNIPDSEKENIRFTITDETIAKITEIDLSGSTIIANTKFLKLGSTTLTATLNYNGKTYTDSYTFTVVDSAYSLSLSANGYTELPVQIDKGKKIQLKVELNIYGGSLLPQDITNNGVTWTTSDAKVATINDSGLVEAIGEGNVILTASYKVDEETIEKTYSLKVIDSNIKTQVVEVPSTGTKTKKIVYIMSIIMIVCGGLIINHNIKMNMKAK